MYDVDEVVCEDKWNTLPFDAKLGLEVAQDVTEVYVKELKKRKNPKHTRPISEACEIRKNQVENGKRKLRLSNLSIAADHDVVTVPISNTQDISGYTVACT